MDDASRNVNSKCVDEMASNGDLSKLPFQNPDEVLAKEEGNQGWKKGELSSLSTRT